MLTANQHILQAFAVQYLAVEKELGLPRERTNVDGGGIAIGHPLAASGARITAHMVHELRYSIHSVMFTCLSKCWLFVWAHLSALLVFHTLCTLHSLLFLCVPISTSLDLCRSLSPIFFNLRRRRHGKYALGSACIGGGQGIAVIIQAV